MRVINIKYCKNIRVVGGSLPDIDIDHCFENGDKVKEYLKNKYGIYQCCSVGTYSTLQLKGAFKELCRLYNIPFGTANDMSKCFTKDNVEWQDIFKIASEDSKFKSFIQHNFELINDIQLIIGSIKSESTHASAFIITPSIQEIFKWIPVRKDENGAIVSEIEGEDLDILGFLKQDILKIKQLTKIKRQLESIKILINKNIDIFKVPLNDSRVYNYFSQGYTEDIFQFGAKGLSSYIQKLKPENIEDLIAAVALFRPGSTGVNTHMEYIMRKHGEKEIEYIHGWEDITEKTYGLLYFQETVMFILQKIAGFDLETCDIIRSALGKKKNELLLSFENQFIEGGIKNGYTKEELIEQWRYIKITSEYLFNKSHAAAYADLGYRSMWLKVNYPIHFWTTAFTFAKDDEIVGYISEITRIGDIRIIPPDINISTDKFTTDFEKNSIAWSLLSIKDVGDIAVKEILEKRSEKKQYFSFEDFFTAHNFKYSKVNKTTIEHLILSGAFDDIESINDVRDRDRLIIQYRTLSKTRIAVKEEDWYFKTKDLHSEIWWWKIQQKSLTGFALFDYEDLLQQAFPESPCQLLNTDDLTNENMIRNKKDIKTGGYIVEINERQNKKMGEYCNIIIEHNYTFIPIYIKPEAFEVVKEILIGSEGKLLLMTGELYWDSYKEINAVQSNHNTEIIILE